MLFLGVHLSLWTAVRVPEIFKRKGNEVVSDKFFSHIIIEILSAR
jgi:hypothetical protein